VNGLPFVGENGFYPSWVRGAGRWIFQRTLVGVGQMAIAAEIAAQRVPSANQVIVWVPKEGRFLRFIFPRVLHEERQNALNQLFNLTLRCYGKDCKLSFSSPQQLQSIISEFGLRPEQWLLLCPYCGGLVGPDLEPVSADRIIRRWQDVGRPSLENPAASAFLKSAAPVNNLPDWIRKIRKNDPSHLELAYLGQQLWPDIKSMLEAMRPTA
jgi:hypothetical protein